MKDVLTDVGKEFLEHASEAEFSAGRGIVVELFPFIFVASKRLSTRAISRWLEETKGIKLSFVTIAKALRNPRESFEKFFDGIEPAAKYFVNAHPKTKLEAVLSSKDVFEFMRKAPPSLSDDLLTDEKDYGEAASVLAGWFTIPDEARRAVLAHVDLVSVAGEVETKVGQNE